MHAPVADSELLAAYSESGDETAFAELARRHQHLVYAACARRLGDPALAQDAAQMTFLLMARQARALRHHANLAGWLYQTANFQASNLRRKELNPACVVFLMETESVAAPANADESPDDALNEHLDDALLSLRAADREAVVLRFFSRKSLRDVGESQGVSEDAARKRIGRALERLADFLRGRGVASSSVAAVTVVLSGPAQSAPAGFLQSVAASAHSAQLVTAATAHAAWWLKVKVAALVTVTTAVPIALQWNANQQLKRDNERLRTHPPVAVETIAPLARKFVEIGPRAGAISFIQTPEPSPLLQLLDALFAAESEQRQASKIASWDAALRLSPLQIVVTRDALRGAATEQREALHALSSGEVQFDRVIAFLRAEQTAHEMIAQVLDASQRAGFAPLVAEDRQSLARDLALWRLADLQLTLQLAESQKPAVLAVLTQSTVEAITDLAAPDVTDMPKLLAKLDAIGGREHAELGKVLTPAQHRAFENQVTLRRKALDVLLDRPDL